MVPSFNQKSDLRKNPDLDPTFEKKNPDPDPSFEKKAGSELSIFFFKIDLIHFSFDIKTFLLSLWSINASR